jgi:muramoyltetrapeptide carboxypeptidase
MSLKPPPLRPGQTLAIVSPAAPSPPESLALGKALLEGKGFHVKVMPHAHQRSTYLAGSDEQRAQDLMQALQDPSVDAVLCARGGYGCARLLPYLDWECLKTIPPKAVMGFSDITVLHQAIAQQLGWVSFYSPMLTSNLTEPEQENTWASWLDLMLWPEERSLPYPIPNWDTYHCLHAGEVKGILRGGNLTLLTTLCGTAYHPRYTQATILVLEDWKERFYSLDRQWTQLVQAGVFQNVVGILLADFSQIPAESDLRLPEFFKSLSQALKIPVGFGFSVGHGPQTATLPLGVAASLDATTGFLLLEESPFSLP